VTHKPEPIAALEAALAKAHADLEFAAGLYRASNERRLAAEAALDDLRPRLAAAEGEAERVKSDREYIIGWNDGFAHVHGPLRFPTMLRKMWSGREVQAWLDAQRIEAAREAAADDDPLLPE